MLVHTPRLRLTALTHAALQAWVDGDRGRLCAETGAVFPDPPDPPPLFADDLAGFRDRMAETPGELGWWVWLAARRDDDEVVGVCGLGGRPDASGTVLLGYAVYPWWEGRGYATEAARTVAEWALAQAGARRVRANVRAGNRGSAAVARKVGMSRVSQARHPSLGELAVYELHDEILESAACRRR